MLFLETTSILPRKFDFFLKKTSIRVKNVQICAVGCWLGVHEFHGLTRN